MIEIELRGYLQGSGAEAFKEYLEQSAQEKTHYREVAMFCHTETIANFGSFQSGKARIQANQKTFEDGSISQIIKLKLDVPSGHDRKEYNIKLAEPGLVGFFEMLKRLGVAEANFRACDRYDYRIADIEIALKYNHPIGDHFEIETTSKSKDGVEQAKQKLLVFLEPFHLKTWEPEEYKKIIIASGPKAPYIPFDKGITTFQIS